MAAFLNTADLKVWLHRQLSQTDKLLAILGSMDEPCQIRDIKQTAKEAGLRTPQRWNCSGLLSSSRGKAILTNQGWELTDSGRQHLTALGIPTRNSTPRNIAATLRAELPKIRDSNVRSYVEEGVKCYEHGLYRSAIVISWVGAVAILHDVVHARHLAQFNAEMKRVDNKWKDVVTTDDFGRLREFRFLDCIERLSVVGKDVRDQLRECLRRRNSCGHPNSLRISANAAAAHLEILILNVFNRFV